ncbi:hypothetical protein HDV02_005500 [Globomyces sp. JEL0801]|nr:hypothetical protein HDV02_005500 [Globomyces sp. JEL0801]
MEELSEETVWKAIQNDLAAIYQIRTKADSDIKKTNKNHLQLAQKELEELSTGKEALTLKTGIRLMAFYKPIIDTIHNEIHVEKTLLENINLLISIQESAELELKKSNKRKMLDDKPSKPKRSKLDEFYNIPVGCHVAAKVSDDAMASEEWILASVVGVVNGKIEVEDIEPEEDQKTKQHHFVNPKFVLVIPNDNLKRYPKGHQVLALYPASSCFYRATVLLAPEHGLTEYIVKFEDDGDFERSVSPNMVLEYPKA